MPVSIVDISIKAKEEEVRAVLSRYFEILEGKAKPNFQLAKKEGRFKLTKKASKLREKIDAGFKLLRKCGLCERNCFVNRIKGEKGYCQLTDKMLISSYFAHHGEEFFLVPSFTIFFWSCNFSCQYCQNWAISQRFEKPRRISEERLAKAIDKGAEGCRNVNFVGGEPTPQLPFILRTLNHIKSDLPVVWNSNFYMSKKSMDLLKGAVDVYLSDFKYGNDRCAERLSKVNNYTAVVKRNHLLASKDKKAALLIRHLMLPDHMDCCTKPILHWIAKNLGNKVIVNILSQYRPEFKAAQYRELRRVIRPEELDEAVEYAKKLGLTYIT